MSELVKEFVETGKAKIVDAPSESNTPRHEVENDRSFELPTGLYAATVCCYFAFLGLTLAAFASSGLAILMVIFALFIVAGFGIPAIWTRLKPDGVSRPMTWGRFGKEGVMTHTGRLASRDAAIQMLILPVLIVLWGMAVVTIAAFV